MSHAFRRNDFILLLVLGAIWGTAFIFISLGLDRFPPFLFAAIRFDIAGAALLAVAALRRRGPLYPQTDRQWVAVFVAGALMTGAYHAFLFWGQRTTTAAIAAVIVGLSPVLTTVFSSFIIRTDRVGWRGVLGLTIGFGGIVLLATLKEGSLLDAQGIGELAVVAAIASWALGSVLIKKAAHGMEPFSFAAWQSLFGALLLHGLSFWREGRPTAVFDEAGWISLLYLSLASSGIGFMIYFTLVEHVGPIRVNLVSYVAPIFATVAGLIVLHEPLELRAVLAFACIAAGFALVARTGAKRPEAPPSAPEEPSRVST